jgi:hypothetical protein
MAWMTIICELHGPWYFSTHNYDGRRILDEGKCPKCLKEEKK